MFELFELYLRQKASFTEEEVDIIRSASSIKKLRKRQYLLHEGTIWSHYAFVCKGCLRTFYLDDKGVEHIMKFSIENWWAGDRESLVNQTPSKTNIDAIEDSILVVFTQVAFDELRKQIPAFDHMINDLLSRTYIAANERIHAAISYTAEERYQAFLKKYPNLLNRVPLHMIASFIGVTPETLSRVRAISSKK